MKLAFALLLVSGAAHASIEAGNWEFSVDSPLVGNGNEPAVKRRCLTALCLGSLPAYLFRTLQHSLLCACVNSLTVHLGPR